MICIIGNVASGKSTLAKSLAEKLPGYELASLDEYRKKFKATTADKEEQAQRALIKKISNTQNLVLECSGTGKWYPYYLMESTSRVQIHLHLEDSECRKRHGARMKGGYKLPPFCYDISVDDAISFIGTNLKTFRSDLKIDVKNKSPEEVFKLVHKFVKSKVSRQKLCSSVRKVFSRRDL